MWQRISCRKLSRWKTSPFPIGSSDNSAEEHHHGLTNICCGLPAWQICSRPCLGKVLFLGQNHSHWNFPITPPNAEEQNRHFHTDHFGQNTFASKYSRPLLPFHTLKCCSLVTRTDPEQLQGAPQKYMLISCPFCKWWVVKFSLTHLSRPLPSIRTAQ